MTQELRVLLVEDSADSRDLYCLAMELEAFAVRGVRTASECLDLLGEFQPDVLVCDLRLPDAHGYGLLRSVRARGHNMPAVAVTALTHGADRKTSLAAGYAEHCVKPFAPDDLVAVIGKLAGPAV